MRYTTIVSAETLCQHYQDPDWRILDTRFDLADPDAGREKYAEGHIPGAVYVHLDEQLSGPVTASTGRHPLPSPGGLLQWLAAEDIRPEHQVVIYDDLAGAMAARGWWLLKLLGFRQVAVLDGGLPQWQHRGYPLQKGAPANSGVAIEPAAIPSIHFPATTIVDTAAVLSNLQSPQFTLVDARAPQRFRGEQEPVDTVAGHIPGAINRPLQANLDTTGCFKSAQQLAQEWQTLLAAQPADRLVHMCGSGVTACHNLLAMEIAGLSGSRIYSGSWSEWICDPCRPVVTGEEG